MKKKLFFCIIGILLTAEAVSANSDKAPLPKGFTERLAVILKGCGSMPLPLMIAILAVILTAAVVVFLIRNEKNDKE